MELPVRQHHARKPTGGTRGRGKVGGWVLWDGRTGGKGSSWELGQKSKGGRAALWCLWAFCQLGGNGGRHWGILLYAGISFFGMPLHVKGIPSPLPSLLSSECLPVCMSLCPFLSLSFFSFSLSLSLSLYLSIYLSTIIDMNPCISISLNRRNYFRLNITEDKSLLHVCQQSLPGTDGGNTFY